MKYRFIPLTEFAAEIFAFVKKQNSPVTLKEVNAKMLSMLEESESGHSKHFEVRYSLDGVIPPKGLSPVTLVLSSPSEDTVSFSYEFSKGAKIEDFDALLTEQGVLSGISPLSIIEATRGDVSIFQFSFNSVEGNMISRVNNTLEKLAQLNLAPPGLTTDKLIEIYQKDSQAFKQSVGSETAAATTVGAGGGAAAAVVPASVSAKAKVAAMHEDTTSKPGDSKENSVKP